MSSLSLSVGPFGRFFSRSAEPSVVAVPLAPGFVSAQCHWPVLISLCESVTARQRAKHAAIDVLPLFSGSLSTISRNTSSTGRITPGCHFPSRGAIRCQPERLTFSSRLITRSMKLNGADGRSGFTFHNAPREKSGVLRHVSMCRQDSPVMSNHAERRTGQVLQMTPLSFGAQQFRFPLAQPLRVLILSPPKR